MRVIVTGSEGLIGKEVVKYLRNLKYLVACCDYFIKPEYDLTKEENVKQIFEKNKADALVNCFAYNPSLPSTCFLKQTTEEFEKYMNINLTTLFSVCREYAKNNVKGSIINFSSTYGIVSPNPSLYDKETDKDIGYCVSKAGVVQLTKVLAVNLAPRIRVNCIVPGGIYNNQPDTFVDKYSKLTPMARMGKAEEIAPLVEFLVSNKSSYCTGGVWTIDGGYTAW